jgi:hypothetical protein
VKAKSRAGETMTPQKSPEVSKTFKITLTGEYAKEYANAHSDFWIEDFFGDNPSGMVSIEAVRSPDAAKHPLMQLEDGKITLVPDASGLVEALQKIEKEADKADASTDEDAYYNGLGQAKQIASEALKRHGVK